MKLTLEGIQNRKQWEEKGYSLPQYEKLQRKILSGSTLELATYSVHSMRMWFKIC